MWNQLLKALPQRGSGYAVEPHPALDTDWGAREHIENLMEAHSRHAGPRP